MCFRFCIIIGVLAATLLLPINAIADFLGHAGVQIRWFPQSPADPEQGSEDFSVVLVPEWYTQWNNKDDSLNAKLFYRYDSVDSYRTHFDLRELYWLHVGEQWELTLGVNKVFWGVTESQHLVDIVNQTDLVEAPDGEEKLGQPMAHLALIRDWGVLDLFILPLFRPRTFPGPDGRLRSLPLTLPDEESYESSREGRHIDFAARWSQNIGEWSIGLSWFRGTAREPLLQPVKQDGADYLLPYYSQITQFGIDLQYTTGDWLWKLEAINRSAHNDFPGDDFYAATFGFEYTWVGFLDNIWDAGLLMEYSYDSRDVLIEGPYQNDLFVGARLNFNDIGSSQALFGVVQDLTYNNSRAIFLEASSRLGNSTRVVLEVYLFDSAGPADPFYSFRRDSYLEFAVEYYF